MLFYSITPQKMQQEYFGVFGALGYCNLFFFISDE